jgi:ribosomal protein L12E/L44/L45/RPP1/RPP2
MKTLAVAAGAIHGLSLSVAYGGPVFAKVGLKPALRKIASKDQRRAVMQSAWSKFSKVNVPAHVGFTASWLILRTMLRGIYLDRSTKNLLVAKDVLIAGALITGVAATVTGKALKRASTKKNAGVGANPPAKPTKAGEAEKPATEKHARKEKQYKRLMRLEKKLGRANMAFLAGAIIISPAIGMGIIRSQRMNILQRLFSR